LAGENLRHMIDFVIMRTSQRNCCMDVQVMRGASCWTDHSMVKCRVRMALSHSVGVWKHPVPFAVHKFSRSGVVDEYVATLKKLCDKRFSSVTCVEVN